MVTHTATITAVLVSRVLGRHRSHNPLHLGICGCLGLMVLLLRSSHLVGPAGERLRELCGGHFGDLGDKG